MKVQRMTWRSSALRALRTASLLAVGACAEVDVADPRDEAGLLAQQGRRDLGKGDGSDVVTIGDSLMHNTLDLLAVETGGGLAPALERAGVRYRNYAAQGVWMLQDSAWGRAIPSQFADAIRATPGIKTVIMSGGGNDVIQTAGMQEDCKAGGAACAQLLSTVGAALARLWDSMGTAGVQDVLFVGYSANAGDSGPNAPSPLRNGIAQICASATRIRCHILDTTPLVARSDLADGFHANRSGNDRVAQSVLRKMEAEGMRR